MAAKFDTPDLKDHLERPALQEGAMAPSAPLAKTAWPKSKSVCGWWQAK